ncbi:MAG: glycosyltransferase [Candidatus Woesearchaeota archaeon]|jgi:glycosyltransferase involved in cell wall biosynthesis|nr:glycosyltransferase [Candidatus Woesearchaeota archaeon]MDP7623148.1 glycosyltransferase [Candidatus Woesearchaeota archaeon]HJN56783.1 glycosyltransferase [Candidatus Woesearchaeota archaeon]|tara:strand:+ start:8865 stop:9563 length:699 start_codon:yes stop_codon:yes gene_type:complete
MLSIIIPTLNEEKYLLGLLNSLKKQTYMDFEVIIADNNSKDRTKQIAKKHGCKIVKGGLPGTARNNGAKKSKGDILLFIDSDCIIKKNFLEKSLSQINKKSTDIAGCMIKPINGKISDNLAFWIYNFWIYFTQFYYANASGHGIFIRKKLHDKINGFNESIRLSEDMDYCKRASRNGKFRILKGIRVYTSTRRFDYYGRLNIFMKLFLSAFYRMLFGEIKTDIFKYRFDYKK